MTKKLYVGKVWRFVYTIIDRRTTQKIYTGKHCTGILDDDYWGSGKYVNKKALEARGGTKNYIFQIDIAMVLPNFAYLGLINKVCMLFPMLPFVSNAMLVVCPMPSSPTTVRAAMPIHGPIG